jgi:hypothetical protein
LAGSTKGAATDEQGEFIIPSVPLGSYELVISMIGYETSMMRLRLSEKINKHLHIRLKPQPISAPELEVTASHPRQWKKHLKKFTKQFIGSSEFASKCMIINPEVLDFDIDNSSQLFSAAASASLEIENRALGYRIQSILVDFTYQEDGILRYIHKPKFNPLSPANAKQKKKWRKNRLEVYHGSTRHFLSALVTDRMEQEGFYIDGVANLSNINNELYLMSLTTEDLIHPGDELFEYQLAFPDYVKVYFNREGEFFHEGGYEVSGDRIRVGRHRDTRQISVIEMNIPSVIVNTTGHLYDPYALTTYGYWASERVAEELPLDYTPEAANSK